MVSSINIVHSPVVSSTGNYYCVMALNQTAQAALQLTGNATITITAPKCVLQVNSNNLDAVDMTGNAKISSVENCFVGKVRSVGNASISPAPIPAARRYRTPSPAISNLPLALAITRTTACRATDPLRFSLASIAAA